MKSFSFETNILIDLRSKIPEEIQFRNQLRSHLIDRILFFDKPFPSVKEIADIIGVEENKVKAVLEHLENERLLYLKNHSYYASYPKFNLSFDDQSKTILEMFENNGMIGSMKRHQSSILDEKTIKKLQLPFEDGVKVHETRIDYYGDDLPFAVTYSYTPTYIIEDIDKILESNTTINEFYKSHTSSLTREYATVATLYPRQVADIFNIPYGKAGLLIKAEYYDDHQMLVNLYRGYINGWYSVQYEGPKQ